MVIKVVLIVSFMIWWSNLNLTKEENLWEKWKKKIMRNKNISNTSIQGHLSTAVRNIRLSWNSKSCQGISSNDWPIERPMKLINGEELSIMMLNRRILIKFPLNFIVSICSRIHIEVFSCNLFCMKMLIRKMIRNSSIIIWGYLIGGPRVLEIFALFWKKWMKGHWKNSFRLSLRRKSLFQRRKLLSMHVSLHRVC